MLTLYTIIFLHLLPIFVLRLYWRARKAPAYAQRIGERFALIPARKGNEPLVWVHAVSVGEVIAATPIVKEIRRQYPGHRVCITTTTPTGSDRVRAAFGDQVLHYYLPYDVPSLVAAFLRAIRPTLLVIMETELWPNVIDVCRHKGIPVVLANGRMSKSSAKGYRKMAWLTRPMLEKVTLIAAQSRMDAERFVYLGASRDRVVITGSVKFDVVIDELVLARQQQLLMQLQCAGRRVAVFASTHPGEDELIMPMVRRLHHLYPDFLAIIVPRHPERFDSVANIASQLKVQCIRLSSGQPCTADTALVLGDTMGDMLAIYGLAQMAFVGGSLIPHGGHNLLEPAAWSLPVLSGSSVHNFQDIARLLAREGGLKLMHDHLDLERHLQSWLSGQDNLVEVGKAANRALLSNRGALQRLMDLLAPFL